MDTAYFRRRLKDSIRLMNSASSPEAKAAHLGLVRGYRRLLKERPIADTAADGLLQHRRRTPPAAGDPDFGPDYGSER